MAQNIPEVRTYDDVDTDPQSVTTPKGFCQSCQRSLATMDELIPADRSGHVYALCCPDCYGTIKRF